MMVRCNNKKCKKKNVCMRFIEEKNSKSIVMEIEPEVNDSENFRCDSIITFKKDFRKYRTILQLR
jgi:hypothetical protein